MTRTSVMWRPPTASIGTWRQQEPFFQQAGTHGRWTSLENQLTIIGAALIEHGCGSLAVGGGGGAGHALAQFWIVRLEMSACHIVAASAALLVSLTPAPRVSRITTLRMLSEPFTFSPGYSWPVMDRPAAESCIHGTSPPTMRMSE